MEGIRVHIFHKKNAKHNLTSKHGNLHQQQYNGLYIILLDKV
jgi:hypothetical protein